MAVKYVVNKTIVFLFLSQFYLLNLNAQVKNGFVTVKGTEIIRPNGQNLLLKGINLGNWLHPEGYMFKFKKTNSAGKINHAINELIGPDETKIFWEEYLNNYITKKDISFLKSIGCNHIRLPFNFRMLTNEDYLGANWHGYKYIDSVLDWCRQEGLWVLLDMHAAPCGQTGDNIDDSYGYPYLFTSTACQQQTVDLWAQIAARYKNDTVILGYDLLNEPIATYFYEDYDKLNPGLEPLYKKIVFEIRKVDTNHLVFLGGAQWNGNFDVFGTPFDNKSVYTFHKYWFEVTDSSVDYFIDFREKYNVPIYLGESGENTDEWVNNFRLLLEKNNIGWCFWPYKKMDNTRGIMNFYKPTEYDSIIEFVESDRSTYKQTRENRPDVKKSTEILHNFNLNSRFENCFPNKGYIEALGFSIKK